MDEQFSIREALLGTMVSSERIDETNAIAVMRECVSLAGVIGWNLDALDDDFRVTERAERLIAMVLA